MSEIEHYMQLVGQLRRQAEIDTAALNRYRATVAADKVLLEAERALADDLALALHVSVKYGRPPEQAAEVLARYREARA